MDDTTETEAETPNLATHEGTDETSGEPETPEDTDDAGDSTDDTTETEAPVVPLIEITLPRPMNVVLVGIRFRRGKAQARLTPLQRLYLTRRAARFEEAPEEPETPEEELTKAVADGAASEQIPAPASDVADEHNDPADNADEQPAGDDDAPGDDETASQETPVPDETWTDEALDALGKERGITWRSNASKATKVAKLTEG